MNRPLLLLTAGLLLGACRSGMVDLASPPQRFDAVVATNDLLRVPEDDRTRAFFEPGMRGQPTDRLVHLYRKPR